MQEVKTEAEQRATLKMRSRIESVSCEYVDIERLVLLSVTIVAMHLYTHMPLVGDFLSPTPRPNIDKSMSCFASKKYKLLEMIATLFQTIKENVTAADAANFYGIERRGKLYKCPFHSDNTPSMQVENRYYCYACGETGDAVDLVSKLYNLRPKQAAEKI